MGITKKSVSCYIAIRNHRIVISIMIRIMKILIAKVFEGDVSSTVFSIIKNKYEEL